MRNSKIGVLSPVCKIPKQDGSGLDVIPTFWSPASMSPYQKGTAPYRGVSSYLLQLWVRQKGLGNWEHRFSPFIPSPFSWALSSTVSLRLRLSSFLHSTNMPEHLLSARLFYCNIYDHLGLYSQISVLGIFCFLEVCANAISVDSSLPESLRVAAPLE